MANENLRFLVVMAHPHDFTHVAGTCGIHAKMGDSITWVSMTSGRMTHNEKLADELQKPIAQQDKSIVEQTPESYAAEKAAELKDVAAQFGVSEVEILEFTDKPFVVERQPQSIEVIRELILKTRPHIILTQSPYISGPHGLVPSTNNDHTETAVAVMEAKLLAQLPRYGQKIAPYTVPATFFPGVYFDHTQWDFAVDVSEFFENRVTAEAMYKSQGHDEQYARRRVGLKLGSDGVTAGVPYAEGFVQEKFQTVPHIQLSDYTLKKGTESRKDQINNIAGQPKT
ncbi:MAG: PIG-L family deacetylase [SAR202 cluster bacterium]|nr:PIG-L family deacetylase [SAR202 cluster bacterium]|tara:strand:+ start:2723 stop:3574 length:852 start_codon:yes stop_codon:yes gene_type:complete